MEGWALACRLARRELRGGLSGLRIFLVSLALGVAAIAAVGTVSKAVIEGLKANARALLGGDVELQLVQRPPSEAEIAYLESHSAKLSHTIEMRAMALPLDSGNARAMVELKAVDRAYPLIGRVDLNPPGPLSEVLARRGGVWGAVVEPTLLEKLGLRAGDSVKIGDARFELRAAIAHEPDRIATVVSFGPRLMIATEALAETNLLQPGSMVRYNNRVKLPEGTAPAEWVAAIKRAFPASGWQLREASGAAPGVQRFVERLGMFLTFAGLTALLVGGLGVGNAVKHYLDGKTETIAILKCLGAPGSLAFDVYFVQIVVLASLGIGVGVVVGAALPLLGLGLLKTILPVRLALGVYPVPLAEAAALGLLTAVAFALWPLGRAREVPAGSLFRQGVTGPVGRLKIGVVVAAFGCALALAALTIASAADRWFGACFVGGAIVTLLILRGGAAAVAAAAARLPRAKSAIVRMAVTNLQRPGAPTPHVIMALGAGLTVLVAVALIDSNLRSQIGDRLTDTVPAFFFIDIQDSQAEVFDAVVRGVPGVGDLKRVPSLRGRIVRIKGVPVESAPIAPEATWAVRGDRALTYAAAPPADAKIVEGAWWSADYAGPPLVSLDAGLAKGFGVGVGDALTLNVLGRDIEVRIASLREIDWRAVPFDFALILTPGALEGAPHTHIAAVRASVEAEPALEKAVTDRFSNVTAIRTREALDAVSGLLAQIGWGVRAAAAVTLVAGALVLAGTIAADRRRREYEAVLFKVLGATRGRIVRIYVVEYGLLGLVTAAVAAGLGTAVAWEVTVFLMEFDWKFRPDVVAATVAGCVVLTLTVGFAHTWRHLGQKAATFLRND